MACNDTRAISKSTEEQLQSSDGEELKYLLKDNFAGKFHWIFSLSYQDV